MILCKLQKIIPIISSKLYLIPNLLYEGSIQLQIPQAIATKIIPKIKHYFVENIKSTRRFLKKIYPSIDITKTHFFPINKHISCETINGYLPILTNKQTAIISEVGNPCIADPGSFLVALAHQNGVEVIPLVGPSSILLALIASGLNGQHFEFYGYLPKQQKLRGKKIKEIEQNLWKTKATQIFMETPFRNNQLLESILKICNKRTKLCIAAGIFSPNQYIKTHSIEEWQKMQSPNINKNPAIFLLGKG